jgi:drug/metabolite transporter (DMT)-like permease
MAITAWAWKNRNGVAAALGAAALFGVSTPLAKLLVREINPWMMAGLLYLGSGLGLAVIQQWRLLQPGDHSPECHLQGSDWGWLLGAIAVGGLAAPVLLMFGLTSTSASTASLLLNLEGVFTALLAWFLFREHYDRRIFLGMVAVTSGAVMLAWTGAWTITTLWGPLAVAGACLAWGMDNNLSRKVALCDPVQIAMIKGFAAGATNLAIASYQYGVFPDVKIVLFAGLLGFLGYGASLVLFIRALRHLGAARSSAYFSVAPFVGGLGGVILFREDVTFRLLAATALMAWGIWLHFTERHEHDHVHEEVYHEHAHAHDPHHQHHHEEHCPGCELSFPLACPFSSDAFSLTFSGYAPLASALTDQLSLYFLGSICVECSFSPWNLSHGFKQP